MVFACTHITKCVSITNMIYTSFYIVKKFYSMENLKKLFFRRRDYQRCIMLAPMYLPPRVNLAYTLQMAGHYYQAWQQLSSAIQIDNGKREYVAYMTVS